MPQPLPPLSAEYQPQQWINDHAVDSDPARGFDAAPILLAMGAVEFRAVSAEIRKFSGRDLDIVAERAGNEATGGHDGPFEIRIDEDDFRAWLEAVGFDPDDVGSVDDSVMAKMRAEYGVAPRAVTAPAGDGLRPGEVVLAGASLVDWRIGEGSGEELSESQKLPREVRIIRHDGSKLGIEVSNPDGGRHYVWMEVDRGNLRLIAYPGDQEEVAAIVSLTDKGVHVAAGSEDQNFLVDGDGHMRRADGPAEPSFADAPAPRV